MTARPPLDVLSWHDYSGADHYDRTQTHDNEGYRTLSLSIYGPPEKPLYAAVMVKRPVLVAEIQYHFMPEANFQQNFNDMAAKGYGPTIVSATGPTNNAAYAIVYSPMSPIPFTRGHITRAEFVQFNKDMQAGGMMLKSADAYGDKTDIRYVAVWHPNPARTAWNCDSTDEADDAYHQRFKALQTQWTRPTLLALTPTPGYGRVAAFKDELIGPWSAFTGMTSTAYRDKSDNMSGQGMYPVHVAAQASTGGNALFSAIYATTENPDARTFHASEPNGHAPFDDAMHTFMSNNGLRGAALAIVQDRRLVYAQGYTLAEPDYPRITANTPFRQASVSKFILALALYQYMQDNPAITPDTTLQSILHLSTPGGALPKDPRFATITLKHLLESTSGLDSTILWSDFHAAKAFNTTVPVTALQKARYCASLTMQRDPGDTQHVVYGNTDYFLLSLVLMKLRSAATLDAALAPLLGPLDITGIRGSTTLIGDQPAGEACTHMGQPDQNMPCDGSWRSADRPLVADQYGGNGCYENILAAGGLSASIVDLARLCATMSARDANPVLKPETIDKMLANAAYCTANYAAPGNHGCYHGFDRMQDVDSSIHLYSGQKAGYLPSHQGVVEVITGGLSIAMVINGNLRKGADQDWETPIRNQTGALVSKWLPTDLFPAYGMMAFRQPSQPFPRLRQEPGKPSRPTLNEAMERVAAAMQGQRPRLPRE
jgi:CubicO group peptidase (beta-lactamase class C family)